MAKVILRGIVAFNLIMALINYVSGDLNGLIFSGFCALIVAVISNDV